MIRKIGNQSLTAADIQQSLQAASKHIGKLGSLKITIQTGQTSKTYSFNQLMRIAKNDNNIALIKQLKSTRDNFINDEAKTHKKRASLRKDFDAKVETITGKLAQIFHKKTHNNNNKEVEMVDLTQTEVTQKFDIKSLDLLEARPLDLVAIEKAYKEMLSASEEDFAAKDFWLPRFENALDILRNFNTFPDINKPEFEFLRKTLVDLSNTPNEQNAKNCQDCILERIEKGTLSPDQIKTVIAFLAHLRENLPDNEINTFKTKLLEIEQAVKNAFPLDDSDYQSALGPDQRKAAKSTHSEISRKLFNAEYERNQAKDAFKKAWDAEKKQMNKSNDPEALTQNQAYQKAKDQRKAAQISLFVLTKEVTALEVELGELLKADKNQGPTS